MIQAKQFPLMQQFCNGSFGANSGGELELDRDISEYGTEAEWLEAEAWLVEFCYYLNIAPKDTRGFCNRLGQLADSAYTIMGQFAHEAPTAFYPDGTDDLVKAPPYLILDRFY